MVHIPIKYFDNSIEKLIMNDKGDWVDLRSRETVVLHKGDFRVIPLNVAMALPEGMEAHIVPRSSTFKTWGILQTNCMGIVDNSYCGDDDEWGMPVYATRDTRIEKGDRICQFRICYNQPRIDFVPVKSTGMPNRNGFGSTGKA